MLDREWLDDHVELYALDGLPADERERMERDLDRLGAQPRAEYLARVSEVRHLMHEYARRYEQTAPEELRSRVLDDFQAGTDRSSGRPDKPIAHLRSQPRHRWFAVAAACLAVVLALTVGMLIGRTVAPEGGDTMTAQGQAVAAIRSAPDAVFAAGSLADDRGTLTVVSSRSRREAVATVWDGTAPLPSDRTLQLWLLDGQRSTVSGGVFEGERQPLVVALDTGTRGFAVTLEPRGGSRSPTTPVLAQVAL